MAAAVGLLSCSLEAMTESISRNKTTELQRCLKEELPQTHPTARPPTDFCFSLNHLTLMTTSTARALLHKKRCSGGNQNKARHTAEKDV